MLETRAWLVAPPDGEAAGLADALGVHPLTAELLRRRGVRTLEDAERFLHPRLADLSDPATLCGMRAAVERVAQAIAAGDRIAIHGDYDVDGISSTAVLLRGLGAVGTAATPPLWYLPHRLRDGYGLSERAVEALAADGARLLIASDCGITATSAVARAGTLGVDVVVLDHHTPGSERPAAIIVQPRRDGQSATPLCAAGLALMFVMALRRHLGLLPAIPPGLVSLAALGTVADVVPLIEDNRRIVAAGLEEIRVGPLPGLAALTEIAEVTGPVTTWHVSWQLAPRLNAPGRLGDPSPSLRLLLTDDDVEARALARDLNAVNRERQEILERTMAEAVLQAESLDQAPAFVVAGEGWHPGIVGLVAGRLAERYHRPAVAIGLSEGSGRGSARSVPGFNLVDALAACEGHLLAFGGHAMAAGLTIAGESIPEFREAFSALAEPGSAERAAASRMFVDAEVRLADLTPPLVSEFARLAPFGAGNPEPVFGVTGVRTLRRRVVGDGRHLRLDVTDGTATLEAIGFAMAAPAELLIFTEALVDLAVVPAEDPEAPGCVRLRVVALDVPGVDPERMLRDTGALVDRLFSRAAEYLDGPRGPGVEDAPAFYSKIAGVTFDGRQQFLAALHAGDRLRLVREPANPHDSHAVRVTTHDGRTLGYLRAPLAGRLAPSIDAGARYRAVVVAVTGGGDRPMGVNILLEREAETAQDMGAGPAGSPVPVRLAARDGLAGLALGERLTAELSARFQLAPSHRDAVAAILGGTRSAILLPPGRGVASVLACGAAAAARDGRCTLVVAPLRRQVMHRADQIRSRLTPLGFRVCAIHGLQSIRERERADAAVRAGEADVVVASWEAVAGGWAQAHAHRIAAVLGDRLSFADAAALAELVPATPASLVNPSGYAGAAPGPAGDSDNPSIVVREEAMRTGVRMIDRRAAADRDRLVEEVVNRGEKCVVYAIGREECVRLAARLRDSAGGDARLAYLHSGLPARVRHIVLQAFRERRLEVLVATSALDEEALPPDVRHVVIAALPPDLEHLADGLGALGFNDRPVSVTVLFGPDEVPPRRAALNARVPDRPQLAALYRALAGWRGDAAVSWPNEETWAYLRAAVPGLTPGAVDAAFAIFEEAGVAAREVAGDHMDVQFSSGTRRDLTTSLRYREGRREREAFEQCAGWALGAGTIQLLGAIVGKRDGDASVRIPTPAERRP